MTEHPLPIRLGFIGLVAVVFLMWSWLFVGQGRKHSRGPVILFVWLAFTGTLAAWGFFQDFQSMPPRIPPFVFTAAAMVLAYIFFSESGRRLIAEVPQKYLIGFQVFRFPVELLLASMAANFLLPVEMTFHGRNFDIITGLSAPLVAAWVSRKGEAQAKPWIVAWNIMGMVLVTIVMVHGLLSVPYPFKVLTLSVDNTGIAAFPEAWLPYFLVPTAYALHLLSLRRALRA